MTDLFLERSFPICQDSGSREGSVIRAEVSWNSILPVLKEHSWRERFRCDSDRPLYFLLNGLLVEFSLSWAKSHVSMLMDPISKFKQIFGHFFQFILSITRNTEFLRDVSSPLKHQTNEMKSKCVFWRVNVGKTRVAVTMFPIYLFAEFPVRVVKCLGSDLV